MLLCYNREIKGWDLCSAQMLTIENKVEVDDAAAIVYGYNIENKS